MPAAWPACTTNIAMGSRALHGVDCCKSMQVLHMAAAFKQLPRARAASYTPSMRPDCSTRHKRTVLLQLQRSHRCPWDRLPLAVERCQGLHRAPWLTLAWLPSFRAWLPCQSPSAASRPGLPSCQSATSCSTQAKCSLSCPALVLTYQAAGQAQEAHFRHTNSCPICRCKHAYRLSSASAWRPAALPEAACSSSASTAAAKPTPLT